MKYEILSSMRKNLRVTIVFVNLLDLPTFQVSYCEE